MKDAQNRPKQAADSGGYLSRDREHLARLQRVRRCYMTRIDYMPGKDALAIFEARKARERPNSMAGTNSAVLDAILTEWAALTGIKCEEVESPKSPGAAVGMTSAFRAGAYDSGEATSLSDAWRPVRASAYDSEAATGINTPIAGVRVRAYDSEPIPDCILRIMERVKPTPPKRVTCDARRHRDGQPCQAKSELGKRRCRFHGGRSTGPRTPEGKARALANLRRGKLQPGRP